LDEDVEFFVVFCRVVEFPGGAVLVEFKIRRVLIVFAVSGKSALEWFTGSRCVDSRLGHG
jgi:hypothetical protein